MSLQNCRSILMTNWLFSLLQDSPVFRDTVPSVFKLVDDNDDDGMIQISVKQFTESVKILCMIKTTTSSR